MQAERRSSSACRNLTSIPIVALGTGILFGMFPALEVSRPHLSDALRETGPMGSRSSTGWRLLVAGVNGRELLVVGQVALSIVLPVGAGLLIQSVARLRTVDLGFRPDNLLIMKLSLPNVRYETREKRVAFYAELERHVKALPGTSHAALMTSIPTDPAIFTNVHIVGQPAVSEREQPSAQLQSTPNRRLFRIFSCRLEAITPRKSVRREISSG